MFGSVYNDYYVKNKKNMQELRTEEEIIALWQGDIKKPKVSIKCITYNHEKYIEDALEGFLIQETDFPFEICIHDDASTDKTADIIRKYEKAYPRIFKTIYQVENQYSQGNSPGHIVNKICKGEYIAVCEGDDYWVDPKKLRIQVQYLDAHPEIVISSFDAIIIDEQGRMVSKSKLPDVHKRDYAPEELIQGKAWLLTLNWMHKNIDVGGIPERHNVLNGDTFLTSLLGQHGGSHHHTDIQSSVYRMHKGGIWSSLDKINKIDAQLNTYFWMYSYYKRIGKEKYAQEYLKKYRQKFADRFTFFEVLGIFLWVIKKNARKLLGDSLYGKLKKIVGR